MNVKFNSLIGNYFVSGYTDNNSLNITIFKDNYYIPIKRYSKSIPINQDIDNLIKEELNKNGFKNYKIKYV